MIDPVYDIGIGVISSFIFGAIIFFIERKFGIILAINKLRHRGSSCQFTFSCNFEKPSKKFEDKLFSCLEERGYKLQMIEKGYKTQLAAVKGNLEALQITIINDNPTNISIAPVQTTVQSASLRLSEITSLLQKVKDDTGSKLESASLQVVLPYNVGVEIKAPKNMTISNYSVEIIDKDVKVILTIGNAVGIHSTDFIQLADTYRAII